MGELEEVNSNCIFVCPFFQRKCHRAPPTAPNARWAPAPVPRLEGRPNGIGHGRALRDAGACLVAVTLGTSNRNTNPLKQNTNKAPPSETLKTRAPDS